MCVFLFEQLEKLFCPHCWFKSITRPLSIIKCWINNLVSNPALIIHLLWSLFLSFPPLLIQHLTQFTCFVHLKTPASSFPCSHCPSFSRPPSFLPTFSLHDLYPTLTFTPFLWLFLGCLSFSSWFSHASSGYERLVLCLWEIGNGEGWQQREEK